MNSSFVRFFLLLITGFSFFSLPLASCQELAKARELAAANRYREAEVIYTQVLANSPGNPEALLGSAFNHSWMGKHQTAENEFKAILERDPKNIEALIGRGYNLAWMGNLKAANHLFQTLEQLDPTNVEVEKARAYLYLWSGNTAVAIDRFEQLVLKYPKETTYYLALAQAYLGENRARRARPVILSALQLEPKNEQAQALLQQSHLQASKLEIDLMGGFSVVEGLRKFDLRGIAVSGQVSKKLRLAFRYDNSLSMDLASFVRLHQNAKSFTIGGAIDWRNNTFTRLDAGVRILPGQITQQVISGEEVFFLKQNWSIKAGGFLGLSPQTGNDWMAFSSVHIPAGPRFAFEPYYFLSRLGGSNKADHRWLLNNIFRTANGYEFSLGLLYGKIPVSESTISGNSLYGTVFSALLPFNEQIWGLASVRYEKGIFQELTSFSFGIKYRLE